MNPKGTPQNLTQNGRPRAFKSEEEVIKAFREFCSHIREDGFKEAPTKLNFSAWTNVDMHTLYLTLNRYYPTIKKEYESLLAEVLTEGAMTGAYQSTMTIFCLKNWCDWTDKQEQKIDMSAKVQRIEDYLAEYDD